MTDHRLAVPIETADKQRRAADPSSSAWVSANAGSGKTFVLTRRVVRLLLDGVEPSRILCLTFTKAAAANMSIRVFETLAAWVSLDDAALTEAIRDTGASRPGPRELAQARRLFARTVETPGGLKILTIHAFCEKLLHAFPFEANVAARFTVIEELRQQELLGRAREATLAEAVAEPASRVGQALAVLARGLSDAGFQALVRDMSSLETRIGEMLRRMGGVEAFAKTLAGALGTGGASVAEIEAAMLSDGLPPAEWDSIGRHLVERGNGSPAGERLIRAAAAAGTARLDAYLDVVLTGKLEPRADSYLAKKLRGAEPALCARLDAERERLSGLLALRRAAAAVERTVTLVTVAGAVLDRYELLKQRAGLLDFADLIERSRVLLARSDSAWVLYKLDAGIDHVLIDEAQDTSPDQWDILRAVSRDFFAGEGQSRTTRTFFAVGDEKQSIYSFQGARPAMFASTHADYKARATGAGLTFESIDLMLSFRSARTVLDVVDRVFAHGDNARGLSAEAGGPKQDPAGQAAGSCSSSMPRDADLRGRAHGGLLRRHEALKRDVPGLVEIWPKVGPAVVAEPTDWRLPLDVHDARDPAVVVAQRVADTIARMIAPGSAETVDAGRNRGRRAIRPGDVLILVRARNRFFDAVIRALKERHVPVAGADRLNLTDHIATMDLMAAGRAALLPDDDLTLACLLKSPLMGFDDDDLMRLAPGRTGSLDAALRASSLPRDRAAADQLGIWRGRAASLTPFAFYTRLLGQDGGRRALLGRLGPEAADVIDEFLALTLAHERDGAPSLLAFLARLDGVSLPIKRDLASGADAVRVMTVHAAKGLEAKIVVLPDTCGAPSGRHDPKLFRLDTGDEAAVIAWSPRAEADPAPVAAQRAALREAALDEHRRLLYVAMTRAEERLYIAGFHGDKGPTPGCWYDMIVPADLGPIETVPAPWDKAETILRRTDPMTAPAVAPPPPPTEPVPLPAWITTAAPVETPAAPPIRPSNALGAADHPDRPNDEAGDGLSGRRDAVLTGRLMHRLLQHMPRLPADARRDAGLRFMARHGRALAPEVRTKLVGDAMAVLDHPALAALFAPGSSAEVAIAATIARAGQPPIDVTGQVDRIGVSEVGVAIAEFKTGRPRGAAETPPSYLAQLALYRAAVMPLYPGRTVRAVLVWTAGPVVVEIAADALDAALRDL